MTAPVSIFRQRRHGVMVARGGCRWRNVRLGFLVCGRGGRWWRGTIWLAEFWVVG